MMYGLSLNMDLVSIHSSSFTSMLVLLPFRALNMQLNASLLHLH